MVFSSTTGGGGRATFYGFRAGMIAGGDGAGQGENGQEN